MDILSKSQEQAALVVLWMEDDPTVVLSLQYSDGLTRTYYQGRVDSRVGNDLPTYYNVMDALEFMTKNRGKNLDGRVLVPIAIARKIAPGWDYAVPE